MDDRVKPFRSVRNFRDFGGYLVPRGRVKSGLLFRSGHFGEVNAPEKARIESFGIALQVDLRRPDERAREPGRWTAPVVITSDKGREMKSPHVEFVSKIEESDPGLAEDWMREYYRTAPFREHHIELFSGWFDALSELEGSAAAIVNCAAGKDRTGLLCAFTKSVLGVSDADILADYMLTNDAARVEERLERATEWFNAATGRNHPADVYRPFIGVREIYLHDAFDAIAREAGSVAGYIRDVLGVDEVKARTIARRLIETA